MTQTDDNTVPEIAALAIVTMIHEDEGGWVFTYRGDDSGGATYGGMTWRTFSRWLDAETEGLDISLETFTHFATTRDPDDQDHNMQLREHIIECYYDLFWLGCKVDQVPEFAQAMFFSACVNMGKKHATKCLQKAANGFFNNRLIVDGIIGQNTFAALHKFDEPLTNHGKTAFKLAFSDAVIDRYVKIVQANADEWARVAEVYIGYNRPEQVDARDYELPSVRQWKNLRGWINRARKYRSM